MGQSNGSSNRKCQMNLKITLVSKIFQNWSCRLEDEKNSFQNSEWIYRGE